MAGVLAGIILCMRGRKQTSKAAHEQTAGSNSLSERQQVTLDILRAQGPLTGNEISKQAGISGLWKRCSELKKLGLIEEGPPRICSVTGMRCATWHMTDPARVPELKKQYAQSDLHTIRDEIDSIFGEMGTLKKRVIKLLERANQDERQLGLFTA